MSERHKKFKEEEWHDEEECKVKLDFEDKREAEEGYNIKREK